MSDKKYTKYLNQASEYKSFQKIRLFGIVSIGVIILTIGSSVWFIYNNIYKTLDRAHEILVFKSDPFFEPIDFDRYERLEEKWQVKHELESPMPGRDPFKSIPVPEVVDDERTTLELSAQE